MSSVDKWADRSNLAIADLQAFSHIVIRRLSEQVRKLAISTKTDDLRPYRQHVGITMALPTRSLQQIHTLISKFRRDLAALSIRDRRAADEVYQLQIDLFPITRIARKERKNGSARNAVSDFVKEPRKSRRVL
jgi:hypothetical protein